jgi:hypothetical protein
MVEEAVDFQDLAFNGGQSIDGGSEIHGPHRTLDRPKNQIVPVMGRLPGEITATSIARRDQTTAALRRETTNSW